MVKNLQTFGNSRGVILDASILKLLNINKKVLITVIGDSIVIKKAEEEK